MKCTMMEQKIAAFVDESLSKEEEKFLLVHLESCESCKDTVEKQRKIYKELQTMGEEELTAPVDFSVSVIDELEEQGAFGEKAAKNNQHRTVREKRKSFSLTTGWMGGAALAAAGLIVVFIGFTGGEVPFIAIDDAMESQEMGDDMGAATDDVLIQEVPESERARDEIDTGDSDRADGEPPVVEDGENDFGALESPEEEAEGPDTSANYPMILAGLFGILTGGVWLYLRVR